MNRKYAMRKAVPLLFILGLIAFSSCRKPAGSNLKMQVSSTFGATPFTLHTTYSTPDGKYYYFDAFNMYLSHIKLIHTDGSMVEVDPLAYISLTDSAAKPINLNEATGSFKGIQFSIGMDSIQSQTPVSGDPGSPYNNEMYWGPDLKYVFIQMEGAADTNKIPMQSISYSIGTNPYYTTVIINKPFSLSATNTIVLNVDLQKLFYGGSDPINIMNSNELVTATIDNAPLAQQFMSIFKTAFSLQ